MKLRFITKQPLVISNIRKKIGADGRFFYEIDRVTGIEFGEEIDG